MDAFWQDLRLGLRGLTKNRGFTTVAVLTLAIGIGATTAIFSVVNAVLLQPLPYDDADRIVSIREERPAMGGNQGPMAFLTNDTLKAWRDETDTLQQIAGYNSRSFTLTGRGEPARVPGAGVSASLFSLLRVPPALGRGFSRDEERPGANTVVVLSHLCWQNRFGGDPDIVGRPLVLDGRPHTVLGVMPPGFHFPDPETEIWTPLVLDMPERHPGEIRLIAFAGLARLKDGVSLEQAQAEGEVVLQRLRDGQQGPAAGLPPAKMRLTPVLDQMVGEVRPALFALVAAVGFVLLIGCANLANLMLARGASRRREIAIRCAIGAGRGRLIRQMLTESLLLSLLGGAAGLLVATGIHRLLPRLAPGDIPRIEEVGLDGWVLLFTMVVSLLTGVVFGLVPALQSARVDVVRSLNEGTASASAGGFRLLGVNRTRSLLVVAEVALAVVLLIGAGLLLRSFMLLIDVDPGYDPRNVITATLNLPHAKYRNEAAGEALFKEALERWSQGPAVESAGLVSFLPLSGAEARIVFGIDGRPQSSNPDEWIIARPQTVSAGFFQAMGMRLAAGRWLTVQDDERAAPVAMVNETFVRRYFAGEEALGQRLRMGGDTPFEIVGIVGDVRHSGLDTEPMPEVYSSYLQPGAGRQAFRMNVVLRTTGDPARVVPYMRQVVLDIDPNLPLDNVATMQSRLQTSVAQPRFYAVLLGFFALLALGLAAVGIYGVLSYSVSQRSREIAVRRALGAQRSHILRLVLRQGLLLTLAGLLLGVAGAVVGTRMLSSLLFGVELTDAATYAAVPVMLGLVALVACYLPARRATRVDPLGALRYE